MIFIERPKLHFVGTVGSPLDERRKGVIRSTRSSSGEQSDGWRSFAKKPRSTHDRVPIIARSWPDHRRSSRLRRHSWKPYDRRSIALQSKPDRRAIVPTILGYSTAKSRRNQGHDSCNQSHVQSAPTTPLISSHDRLYCPRFWANFLFKTNVILPLFFNF